jgi:hypothetical protein
MSTGILAFRSGAFGSIRALTQNGVKDFPFVLSTHIPDFVEIRYNKRLAHNADKHLRIS